MKNLFIRLEKLFMKLFYFFFKLLPQQRKAVFISRQSNDIPLDFKMLRNQIRKDDSSIITVMLCRTLGKTHKEGMHYILHMFSQMYHIATARLVILDGYCIAVSVLKHRKNLKVIQLWHALGIFKKFGYLAINSAEGRDGKLAKIMCMHKNYDYVICSSPFIRHQIARAYDVEENKVFALGLPRMDYLRNISENAALKKSIYNLFPVLLNSRKTVLYVPTFRNGLGVRYKELVKHFDTTKFNIIVKLHSGKELIYRDNNCYKSNSAFKGMDFMSVCDYVISDYSAIIFEAIIADKPLYLYCYDIETYIDRRGLFIDYDSVPAVKSTDAEVIAKSIENGVVNTNGLRAFRHRYLTHYKLKITTALSKMCIDCIDGKDIDEENIRKNYALKEKQVNR